MVSNPAWMRKERDWSSKNFIGGTLATCAPYAVDKLVRGCSFFFITKLWNQNGTQFPVVQWKGPAWKSYFVWGYAVLGQQRWWRQYLWGILFFNQNFRKILKFWILNLLKVKQRATNYVTFQSSPLWWKTCLLDVGCYRISQVCKYMLRKNLEILSMLDKVV